MLIRKATSEDYSHFFELNKEVQELHHQNHPEKFKKTSKKVLSQKRFDDLLREKSNLLLFAFEGAQAAGYVFASLKKESSDPLRHPNKVFYIQHLSVAQAFRKRGVATKLLTAALDSAAKKKIKLIQLDVWSFNQEAMHFFTKNKFTVFNLKMERTI